MAYSKSFANGKPIDHQAWAENQIAKRTRAALEARDAAFAERHAETPLLQLAQYLRRCADTLKHSPSPNEVDGGDFIEQRFGSWEAAMWKARLPPPTSMRKLKDTARYKQEKAIQEPLYREERKKKWALKCERKEQAKREKKAKKHAERAAQAEWEAKKKAKAEAVALADSITETVAETGLMATAVNNDVGPDAGLTAACIKTSPRQAETV